MPEPYEPHIALAKIRSILQNGRFLIVSHCYERMRKRGVYEEDILHVLNENGIITSKPELDEKHQKYKYRVEGFDIEGDELTIIVNIFDEKTLVVTITVY
jgi:hypothetical protein